MYIDLHGNVGRTTVFFNGMSTRFHDLGELVDTGREKIMMWFSKRNDSLPSLESFKIVIIRKALPKYSLLLLALPLAARKCDTVHRVLTDRKSTAYTGRT